MVGVVRENNLEYLNEFYMKTSIPKMHSKDNTGEQLTSLSSLQETTVETFASTMPAGETVYSRNLTLLVYQLF